MLLRALRVQNSDSVQSDATHFAATKSYTGVELHRNRVSNLSAHDRSADLIFLCCGLVVEACVVPVARPSLNGLPSETLKRSEYLETAEASPGPESRRDRISRASKAEIVLATVASVLAGTISANAYESAEANTFVVIRGFFDEMSFFGKGSQAISTSERVQQEAEEGSTIPKQVMPPWLRHLE